LHWAVFEMTFHFGSKPRWWNSLPGDRVGLKLYFGFVMVGAAGLYWIFSHPVALGCIGGLIVGGILVALVIRWQRGDGF
jgi:hypothetical protein